MNFKMSKVKYKEDTIDKQQKFGKTKKYTCEYCDKEYRSSGGLILHKKSEHFKLRHQCNLCDFQAKQKNSLEGHKRRFHENNSV